MPWSIVGGRPRANGCSTPTTRDVMDAQHDLLSTFAEDLRGIALLDRYQRDGIVASWWRTVRYDLRTLTAQGPAGLVDSWVATVSSLIEAAAENGSQPTDIDMDFVVELAPDYVQELVELEARDAELTGSIDQASEEDADEDDPDLLGAWKRERTGVRRHLRAKRGALLAAVQEARTGLDEMDDVALVLGVLRRHLREETLRQIQRERQILIDRLDALRIKYESSLHTLDKQARAAADDLGRVLRELGYA